MHSWMQGDMFADLLPPFEELRGKRLDVSAPAATSARQYNIDPEIQLTEDEVDQFCKVGYKKMALMMFITGLQDALYAETSEEREAALAYFEEDEGALPFERVLEWLGPPLDEVPAALWAKRIREDPAQAYRSLHRYHNSTKSYDARVEKLIAAQQAMASEQEPCVLERSRGG